MSDELACRCIRIAAILPDRRIACDQTGASIWVLNELNRVFGALLMRKVELIREPEPGRAPRSAC